MKRSRHARLVLMGLAPLALSACSPQEEAFVFQSVGECASEGSLTVTECQAAFDQAQAQAADNSPRYTNRADCVADFGEEQCRGSTSHSYFMPLMTGFLLGRALGGGFAPQPLYRPSGGGGYVTNGGYAVGNRTGRVAVPPAALKPQVAQTQSRSGFGARAAARSSGAAS